MSSKFEPVIWLRNNGHIGIHGGADGRAYVRTDIHDVMAIKPNFLTSMGYHIFLAMVLHARARARSSAIKSQVVPPIPKESPVSRMEQLRPISVPDIIIRLFERTV